jgi:hypothetical protein
VGRFTGTHWSMPDVSKPQGLFRRGNVWYFRCRVPLDLVEAINKAELKESLRTQDHAEAKARRNRVAAKFDRLFEEARAKLTAQEPVRARWSEQDALSAICKYVASADASRAADYMINWSSDVLSAGRRNLLCVKTGRNGWSQ